MNQPTTTPKPINPGKAVCYAVLFPVLRDVARAHGYSLTIHGSLVRDMDLVAVPWVPEASDALTLVRALKEALGAVTWGDDIDQYYPDCEPKQKPHGRVAYSLHFTNRGSEGAYIDLSIMPRIPAA